MTLPDLAAHRQRQHPPPAEFPEAPIDHWALPRAVYSIPRLNWDEISGQAPPVLLYGPPGSALKILRCARPVLREGVPCFAVVFSAADEKTRLVVSRRLSRLVGDFGAACETIRQHEDANEGVKGAVVMTVAWGQRERVQMLLLASLEQDQALQRMLLRAGMSEERMSLDRRLLKDFLRRGGGVARHFKGPRTRRYRFSDFRLDDQVNFGVGLHLKLMFDDHEIMDFAMQRFSEFSEGFAIRTVPCALKLLMTHQKSLDGANTDMLWADQTITLTAGLNRPATRRQATAFLEMVCGLDGVEAPLSESLLSEGPFDRDRGITVPSL